MTADLLIPVGDAAPEPGADDLARGLRALTERARSLLRRRAEQDPLVTEPTRGLYLTEEGVRLLLDRPAPSADEQPRPAPLTPPAGRGDRLARLGAVFGLSELDLQVLLVALAPDVDPRLEWCFGYLNDDVTRRRATVGLALELTGRGFADGAARGRLRPGAPLVDQGLVGVEEPERPFLGRVLRVPDRVTAHLLGDDAPDPRLRSALVPQDRAARPDERLVDALRDGVPLVYLRTAADGSGADAAAASVRACGTGALLLDVARADDDPDLVPLARAVAREARLAGAGVVAGPLEALRTDAERRAFCALGVPTVVHGTSRWNPDWSDDVPLVLDAEALPHRSRVALARARLAGDRVAPGLDLDSALAGLTLGPRQLVDAVRAASLLAAAEHRPVGAAHLAMGVRAQNAAGLERLARRLVPAVGWEDLVLPDRPLAQLHEVAARVRWRGTVLDEWRMRPGAGRGRGVSTLFAGTSGTGKTMAAEVLAAELGVDLYLVDLATVVDKYVGETEKNLDRIFTEADRINGVLVFDEADAVFGKRSEVRDAHDRYANIETAYLLQRLETFDGLAVLTTNLKANIDEAFSRRLDVVVDFPEPDVAARRALWDKALGVHMPRSPDVDLDHLAGSFELAGGHIRSAVLTAAYTSAEARRPVAMLDVVRAVAAEYRKLGRRCGREDFGEWLDRL